MIPVGIIPKQLFVRGATPCRRCRLVLVCHRHHPVLFHHPCRLPIMVVGEVALCRHHSLWCHFCLGCRNPSWVSFPSSCLGGWLPLFIIAAQLFCRCGLCLRLPLSLGAIFCPGCRSLRAAFPSSCFVRRSTLGPPCQCFLLHRCQLCVLTLISHRQKILYIVAVRVSTGGKQHWQWQTQPAIAPPPVQPSPYLKIDVNVAPCSNILTFPAAGLKGRGSGTSGGIRGALVSEFLVVG